SRLTCLSQMGPMKTSGGFSSRSTNAPAGSFTYTSQCRKHTSYSTRHGTLAVHPLLSVVFCPRRAALSTPAEVSNEISEVRVSLLAKAEAAETAYKKGYDLLDRYRFQESIPYLQQALA